MRPVRTFTAAVALLVLAGCAASHHGGDPPRPADGGDWVAVGHEKAYGAITVHVVSAYDQDCELIVRDQRTSQRLGMTQGETTTVLGASLEVLTTRKNSGVTLHVTSE
jgi:hypothetical protein